MTLQRRVDKHNTLFSISDIFRTSMSEFQSMGVPDLRDSVVRVVEVNGPSEMYIRTPKDTEQLKIIQTE